MTTLATMPASFPVTYYQEHVYEMPRSKWAMLTGLAEDAPANELVATHVEVVRKKLGRGGHIPEVLVWNPDPPEHDFPLKEQAALMDQLAQREHGTIPIEVVEFSEDAGTIRATYRVLVSEEKLIEEEQLQEGPAPVREARLPLGPFVAGALISGAFGVFILGRHAKPWMRIFVGSVTGLLGGAAAVQVTKKMGEKNVS